MPGVSTDDVNENDKQIAAWPDNNFVFIVSLAHSWSQLGII